MILFPSSTFSPPFFPPSKCPNNTFASPFIFSMNVALRSFCDGDGESPECGRRCASGGRFASACVAPRLFSPSLCGSEMCSGGGCSFAGW